ncbi:MAG: ribonuclease HIII [Megasphaera sp.]|jgi:ribonuclease HIII|nr:ribonuclease HIII [Megasphaera sp.]MCI1822908.1 ribonuclease HIII [Megasphaera sp.]
MDNMLIEYITACKMKLAKRSVQVKREKKINYGQQVVFFKEDMETAVNFYCGKKGVSAVVQGKESPLKSQIEETITAKSVFAETGHISKNKEEIVPAGTDHWMGCDESGKGDVFGPLVCAACIVTKEEASVLKKAGVCDSKMLTDKVIASLAKDIEKMLQGRCITRVVMPEEYNSLYDVYKKEHKNLNNLLGDLHAKNIRVLLSKYNCPCIIVDKFGKDQYVLSGLEGLEKNHQIIQVTKGERDTAVAAASILARDGFVRAMSELSNRFCIELPKGAYMGISETIQAIIQKQGIHDLPYVGKLNFKNFDFLR